MIKIHHFSDTHGYHDLLKMHDDTDLLICSGDASNARDPYLNEPQMREFLNWFANQKGEKIYCAGNHDTSIEKKLIRKNEFKLLGITYLEDEYYTTDSGHTVFGSPWTPTFGNGWAYNRDRSKMDNIWRSVVANIDIIVTHGPPKGILDIATGYYDSTDGRRYGNIIEYCGDLSMRKHVLDRIKPKLVCFGHIHDNDNNINHGIRILDDVIFSNGSVVTDGKFGTLSSNGNIITI